MKKIITVLLLTGVAWPTFGQGLCQTKDTLRDCWRRHVAVSDDEKTETNDKAEKNVKTAPTGVETGGLNLGSNTKNFLPLLAMSGLLGQASKGEDQNSLHFDLNFLIPGLGDSKNAQLSLDVNQKPEIHAALAKAIPEDGRDDAVKKLNDSLGDLDDYTVSFTYNRQGPRYGRNFKQYRDRFEKMVAAVAKELEDDGEASFPLDSIDERLTAIEDLQDELGVDPSDSLDTGEVDDPLDLTFKQFEEAWIDLERMRLSLRLEALYDEHGLGAIDAGDSFRSLARAAAQDAADPAGVRDAFGAVAEDLAIPARWTHFTIPEIAGKLGTRETHALMAGVEEAAQAHKRSVAAFEKKLKDKDLDLFADLVANQPQLHFSAKFRLREPLIGGDETSIKVTYEWGAVNLNRAMGKACMTDAFDADSCLGEYDDFVDDEKRKRIKDSARMSFSGEYVEVDDEQLSLPDLGVDSLRLEESKKLIISAGWSQRFGGDVAGGTPLRLDAVGKYEDVSDDPMRQDRLVASVTVTRQFGDLALPFGIVYANHGEFLGDVDEKLSAHLGVKFNGFTSQKKEQKGQ